MIKKLTILALVMVMVLSLFVGCSGGTEATPAADVEEAPAADAEEAPTADAEEAPAAEDSAVEPLEIKFSATFQETETGGQIIQHYVDKLAEMSDGQITVDVAWGGTLFTAMDELDAVIDGSVDMIAVAHMPHLNTLNYCAFPAFAPGSPSDALEFFDTLMFKNEETAALIQGEATDLGIKYLNVVAGGANAFCAKNEFSTLEGLVANSTAFGNMDAAVWEKLGFQVTMAFPPDVYDGLNRGLIDTTQMALSPMYAMSWYEQAPYWALDGTYAAGNFFTVNLDWWDGLSTAQQGILQQAATETQDYTGQLYDDAIANEVKAIEDATGNAFVQFTQEELDAIWKANFDAKVESALAIAETAGKTEGMITILEKAAEITGYNWEH